MRAIDGDELLKVTVKRNSIWNAITNSSGEGLEEIINNQPTIKSPRWIPVSERLPEEGARVLISLNIKSIKKVVRSATYWGEGCFHSDVGDYWNTQEDIELLAWMPLPEPYKESGDKE